MDERLRSLRRLLSVQGQVHRLAEWRLADLQRREAAIESAQQALHRFLDQDQPIGGLLLAAVARRRRKLAEDLARAKQAKEKEADRLLQEARRLKLAERLFETRDREDRQEREKQDLAELIERALARRDASLP